MEAAEGPSPSPPRSDGLAQEEEPRLRYGPLIDELQRSAATEGAAATRLAVSDKVLAVGLRGGQVHLLSHQGDQASLGNSRRRMPCPLGTANIAASGCRLSLTTPSWLRFPMASVRSALTRSTLRR